MSRQPLKVEATLKSSVHLNIPYFIQSQLPQDTGQGALIMGLASWVWTCAIEQSPVLGKAKHCLMFYLITFKLSPAFSLCTMRPHKLCS